MQRLKEIKKIGTSIGVIFNKEESRIYDIDVGDVVEVNLKKIGKEEENDG